MPNRPVGFDAPGLEELKRLCEKDAGLKIYKTVEADGYYDASRKGGVLWQLVPSDYRFVEFCDYDSKRPSFDEPGCWRLTKVSRETGQCDERVDKTLWKSGSEATIAFREQSCIAVEKIEKPTARYHYHSDFKKWTATNEVSKYTRTDVSIEDTKTSEILGRYIYYSYTEKPRHTIRKGCKYFGDDYLSYKEANLINTVLKPVNEGVGHD